MVAVVVKGGTKGNGRIKKREEENRWWSGGV